MCSNTGHFVNDILMSLGQNHNHTADVVSLAGEAFVYQIKKRCREQVTLIPTIYDEEIGCLINRDYDDDVGEMIKKYQHLRDVEGPCTEVAVNLYQSYQNHKKMLIFKVRLLKHQLMKDFYSVTIPMTKI